MSDTTCLASDPTTIALSWIASRGIEVRSHPSTVSSSTSKPADHPVLHLLDPGVEPPRCGKLEDWIRRPIDVDELHARADHLLARARSLGASLVCMGEDDTLHVGDVIIILSEQEGRLMSALIDHLGELVLREDLTAAVWPDGPPQDPRALDNRIKAVRKRIADVPLDLHTVWGRGLLLERRGSP